jgi:hypothetical protein
LDLDSSRPERGAGQIAEPLPAAATFSWDTTSRIRR